MIARMEDDGLHIYRNNHQVRFVPLKDWEPLNEYNWQMEISPDRRAIVAETSRFGEGYGTLPLEQASEHPVFDWVIIDLTTGRHRRISSHPRYGNLRRWMSFAGTSWALFEKDKEHGLGHRPEVVTGTLTIYRLPDAKKVYRKHLRQFYGGVWVPGEKFVYRTARSTQRDLKYDPVFVLNGKTLRTQRLNAVAGLRLLGPIRDTAELGRTLRLYIRPNETFTYGLGRRPPERPEDQEPYSRVHLVNFRAQTEKVVDLPGCDGAVDLSPDGKWLLGVVTPEFGNHSSWYLGWGYLPDSKFTPLNWGPDPLRAVREYNLAIQIAGTRVEHARTGRIYEMVGVH